MAVLGFAALMDTAMSHLARGSLNPAITTAGGHFAWEGIGLGAFWSKLLNHRHNLGDNITRLLQNYRITKADIKPIDLVFIV